ncbi:MAG: SRPBCC domain-containing protein, partial [Microthrixaceae bacterium]
MNPTVHSRVDPAARSVVITTEFDHPVATVWTLFSDPTKLARWWGPPGLPMTVDRHDLRPGGVVEVTV